MNRARAASFSPPRVRGKVRRLGIILGDQLDRRALLLEQIDKKADAILMMEVIEESQHVISHKQRIALFLSAMRHFALDLKEAGFRVHYVSLSDNLGHAFPDVLASCTRKFACNEWLVTEPGEWRVLRQLEEAARASDTSLTILDDHHFLSDRAHFAQWMKNRKQPVMEHFYRAERKRLDILMQEDGTPEAGQWNFDKDNRQTFKTKPDTRKPYTPRNDEITREVIACVADEFADHPGELDGFRWAVTRDQALRVLDDFIDHRLPDFGTFQDAMWEDEPFLNHSLLSPAINLKLLHPRECVDKAVEAYRTGRAPLNSVEGFVRQLIGWREFIRGIYWYEGESYGTRNGLSQYGELPAFYWNADTDMNCMRQCLQQVLDYGYGHHIQRLMVTGNFALIAGINPRLISDWYLAMYVDAVDWVTLPNTLGMVMHADGGVVGTKPYAASGKYISRMSNYCKGCQYDPGQRHGDQACPFTAFYWDFLIRNEKRLKQNHRMAMILKNVQKMSADEKKRIGQTTQRLRSDMGIDTSAPEPS